MSVPRVVLRPRRARPFFARHPWVYAPSIAQVDTEAEAGSEVALTSAEGLFVARGLYNPASKLAVRLYRWADAPLDDDFWRARLASALRLRSTVLGLDGPGTAARLVASEGDGLSGLVVDRYDRWLVAQFNSLALWTRRDGLVSLLMELTGAEGARVRTDPAMARLEGLPVEDYAVGALPDAPVAIDQDGNRFLVDLSSGQKTGFFLDQRGNRRAAAAYARNRSVLDLFCYTGGFALSLARAGASGVLGIDSSEAALALARRNAEANGLDHVRFESADVSQKLDRLRAEGQRFGLVVCDPPKFARSARDLDNALSAYVRLNRGAVDVLEPGGILVTCSCSGLVDRAMFLGVLARVADLSGRDVQVLEQRGQAPDHPIAATCPETEYLKCVIAHVA
jgi:23S rRNA (cytosine1962-C5)-methyltransferase